MKTKKTTKRTSWLVPLAVAGSPFAAKLSWIIYSHLFIPHNIPLPPAVSGERKSFDGQAGKLTYYVAGSRSARPLLLIHSVNAAASSFEARPLFEHYRCSRRVYSLDLPGFGFSERSARAYTPRLMTNAILDMMNVIASEMGKVPVDAIGLSLGNEFLARAASEQPERFRSLALISPTGFRHKDQYYAETSSVLGNPKTLKIFLFPLWSRPLYDLINTRVSQRSFLKKVFSTYGDSYEALLAYDYLSAHQKGARFAPFTFVSSLLFSTDIDRVYDSLTMPVWVAHGKFSKFTEVDHSKVTVRGWTVQTFSTGGFPHYEQPEQFFAAYDAFQGRIG